MAPQDTANKYERAEPPLVGLAEPDIGDAERAMVVEALLSSKIAYGDPVERFEKAMADTMGRAYAVGVSSGTAALHLALLAVDVRPDDEVLLPSLTFIAPANAASYVGAHPVLFDSEPDYRQLDVERLKAWLELTCDRDGRTNQATGRRIGAVISVDLLGHPCNLAELVPLLNERGIPLVHDAAESVGSRLRGRPVGDGADVVCTSFNANKIITGAGGGMVLCDEAERAEKVLLLASQAKRNGLGYVHDNIGFNYRLNCPTAALAHGQLMRLEEFLAAKRRVAAKYTADLAGLTQLTTPSDAPWAENNQWLYTVHLTQEAGLTARALHTQLRRFGIDSRPIFTPLHQDGVYQGRQGHPCPVAERLALTGLSLPSSVKLQDADQTEITTAIRRILTGDLIGDSRLPYPA